MDIEIGQITLQPLIVGTEQKRTQFFYWPCHCLAYHIRLLNIQIRPVTWHYSNHVIVVVAFLEVTQLLVPEFCWQRVSHHGIQNLQVDLVLYFFSKFLGGLLHFVLEVADSDFC